MPLPKKFDTALVITCYKRADYLTQCFDSLKRAEIPANCMVIIVDDCSKDRKVSRAINEFDLSGIEVVKLRHSFNAGVASALLTGWDYAVSNGCESLMCLDSDAIVKPRFVQILAQLHEQNALSIVSGFNTLTENRHPIIYDMGDHVIKRSIGGINMLMSKRQYEMIVRPILFEGYGWDWKVCRQMQQYGLNFVVSKPSVVQHIGQDSTHKHINADYAEDF